MSSTFRVVDSFEWYTSRPGRFDVPGVLDDDNGPMYRLGGPGGLFAFTMGLAFWWPGEQRSIVRFYSPYYHPNGGPDGTCGEGTLQREMGTLYADYRGGVRFAGKVYLDASGAGVDYAVSSTGPQVLVRDAWNFVELKANLQRVSSLGARLCGIPDPGGSPIGMFAVRINGTEVLRSTAQGQHPTVFCGCLLLENDFDCGIAFIEPRTGSNSRNKIDDLYVAEWDSEVAGEEPWLGDFRSLLLPIAGAGAAAQWTPVGAATNWQAAAENDTSAYNRTNQTGKRDSFALEASADVTSQVVRAVPLLVGRQQYSLGAPALKALYRRDGIDYLTPELALATSLMSAGGEAGIPLSGETLASLSAGEIGYTTEE